MNIYHANIDLNKRIEEEEFKELLHWLSKQYGYRFTIKKHPRIQDYYLKGDNSFLSLRNGPVIITIANKTGLIVDISVIPARRESRRYTHLVSINGVDKEMIKVIKKYFQNKWIRKTIHSKTI